MWRLMHLITGSDYVHMKNSADEIIRRVRHTANGEPYAVYFGSHLIFLNRPDGWEITPLTNGRR